MREPYTTLEMADFLIIESTFGLPRFTFPDPRESEKVIIGIVEDLIDRGKVPTFMANPYGKAQEIIKILNVHGYSVSVDREIAKVSKFYMKFGVRLKFEKEGEVKVSSSKGISVSGFGRIKLSNHADFWELLEIVERVNPEKVFTVYGHAEAFAKILNGLGYEAKSIRRNQKLEVW